MGYRGFTGPNVFSRELIWQWYMSYGDFLTFLVLHERLKGMPWVCHGFS